MAVNYYVFIILTGAHYYFDKLKANSYQRETSMSQVSNRYAKRLDQ